MAYGSACVRSVPVSFTPTPAAISSFAASISPLRAANSSGVKPFDVERCTSAPPSISRRTNSRWPPEIAHISAVASAPVVAALTLAPRATSALPTATLPVRAAIISGVRPLSCARFGLAPASSSRSTIAAFAFSQARASAVTP